LVASGTVFRTILIWAPLQIETTRNNVLYKLEAHAGVIFDVKFIENDIIGSVSDDRSLRIWKIDLA
jgi:WD40 repeat protein